MATISREFTRVLNPPQLDAELRVSVPTLFGTAGGLPVSRYSLTPLGTNQWRIEIPDDVPVADVQTAITNHNPTTTTARQQLEATNKTDWQNIKDQAPAALARLDAIQNAPLSPSANTAALNRLETAVKDIAKYEILIMRALGILARDAS
jgi:hypothetical protein